MENNNWNNKIDVLFAIEIIKIIKSLIIGINR